MEGIFARLVISRILSREGEFLCMNLAPNLDGLPDWVKGAWRAGMFVMSADDGFAGLWVASSRYGISVLAQPDNILIHHGAGFIGVLSDV